MEKWGRVEWKFGGDGCIVVEWSLGDRGLKG